MAGARIDREVTIQGTRDWVRLASSHVTGRVIVSGSRGPVAPDLSGTTIDGSLACADNASPPVLDGTAVTGTRSGQCAE